MQQYAPSDLYKFDGSVPPDIEDLYQFDGTSIYKNVYKFDGVNVPGDASKRTPLKSVMFSTMKNLADWT